MKIITLTRKTKRVHKKYSMFSISPFRFCPSLLMRVPRLARPRAREGGTSTSCAHRRGSMQLHGKNLQEWSPSVLGGVIYHNNATADAQRDPEGCAARAVPQRSSLRPHACLLTDAGRNLSSVKKSLRGHEGPKTTNRNNSTTQRTQARRWADQGSSAGTRAAPNGACETTQRLT